MLDRHISMQVFLALVRRGTFTAAAAELGISRAMASKHIQALEDHLGVRLFNRTTRNNRLTAAGARYFERVDALLAELDEVEASLGEEAARVSGTLTLAAPPAFGAIHVAPLVAAFMARHPDVRLRLTLADRRLDLVDEGIDAAVTVRELEDTSYIARYLTAVRLIVCAAPAYLARHPAPSTPEDLVGHNCLTYAEAGAATRTQWRFQAGGAPLDVRVDGNFVSNVGAALRNVALAGHGIARLPDYIVTADLADGRLVALLGDWAPALRPVHVLYPHREHVPARLRAFLDFAREWFAARDGGDTP